MRVFVTRYQCSVELDIQDGAVPGISIPGSVMLLLLSSGNGPSMLLLLLLLLLFGIDVDVIGCGIVSGRKEKEKGRSRVSGSMHSLTKTVEGIEGPKAIACHGARKYATLCPFSLLSLLPISSRRERFSLPAKGIGEAVVFALGVVVVVVVEAEIVGECEGGIAAELGGGGGGGGGEEEE